MKLLIIGGTAFLGRFVATQALGRGWTVTTFNRGRSSPDVDGVEALRGDRDDDVALAQLASRSFDIVVDTCGFVPGTTGKSAQALAGSGAHYVFVSSVAATPTWPRQPTPEGLIGKACPADAGPGDGDYGMLKAGCERAVAEVFGERSSVVRPGLIIGPYENVGRLPWWLARIARGGEVLAPGRPNRPMQLIDVRDLATFLLDCGERSTGGTFNATGPKGNTTMGGWLRDCVDVTGSDARLTWVSDTVLLAHDVKPWTELPLWMPDGLVGLDNGDHAWDVDTTRAAAAGLSCRPVWESIASTWAWLRTRGGSLAPAPAQLPRQGIDAARETAILAAWHGRQAHPPGGNRRRASMLRMDELQHLRPTFTDILGAAARIAPHAHVTPVQRARSIDALAGCTLYFKCEHLQRAGAFKFRGACNAVWALPDDLATRGVVTHSSGNHGGALALAARTRGIACHVVVPEGAVAGKLAAIQAYGASLHCCAPTIAARESACDAVQRMTGATLVHPYVDPLVIAGQGTAALELLTTCRDLDALVVPVGGGGLASGTALAAAALAPHCKLYVAEPSGAAETAASLARGSRVTDFIPDTVCDGLRGTLGVLNFELLRAHDVEALVVDDVDTLAAMRLIWNRMKQLVEPSSATALAAVLRYPERFAGQRVGIILSGGNADIDALSR